MPLERAYCVVCGRAYGWVSVDSFAHVEPEQVIVVCDECDARLGKMPLPELQVKIAKES